MKTFSFCACYVRYAKYYHALSLSLSLSIYLSAARMSCFIFFFVLELDSHSEDHSRDEHTHVKAQQRGEHIATFLHKPFRMVMAKDADGRSSFGCDSPLGEGIWTTPWPYTMLVGYVVWCVCGANA